MVNSTTISESQIQAQLERSWEIMQFDTQSAFEIINSITSLSTISKETEAECQFHLGWCSIYEGEPELASKYLLEAISLYTLVQNRAKLVRCFNGLGVSYMEQSLYQSAIKSLTQSLELNSQSDDLELEIPTLLNIVIIYLELGNTSSAFTTLATIRSIIDDVSIIEPISEDNLSLFHCCMAEAMQAQGQHECADPHIELSKKLAVSSQCTLIIFLAELGAVRQVKLKNQIECALHSYAKLLSNFDRTTVGVSYYIAQYEYAQTYYSLNRFNDAAEILTSMTDSYGQDHKSAIIIKALDLLSHCYAKTGHFEQAYYALEKVSIDREWLDGAEAQQQLELFRQKCRIEDLEQKANNEREMRLELETLHNRFLLIEKMGQSLASSLDMSVVINKLYSAISKVMNLSALCLGFHDSKHNCLEFKYAIEFDEQLTQYNIPLDQAISFNARCFIQQETVLIDREDILTTSDLEIGDVRMHSAIFIPISMNNKPIGVLTLQSVDDNAFDPQLVTLLQGITNYLTIAVNNSMSHNKIIELHDTLQIEKEEVEYLALHDGLTQLPNRRMLIDHVNVTIKQSEINHTTFHMLYLDLNGFKQVNDQFGHTVGDKLLIKFSERMRRSFSNIGLFSRIGGDEFVFIIPTSNPLTDIDVLINSISNKITKTFIIDGEKIHIASSIGQAQYPLDGTSFDTLLHVADLSMYQEKSAKE